MLRGLLLVFQGSDAPALKSEARKVEVAEIISTGNY